MKYLILASLAAFSLAACGGSGSAVVEEAVLPDGGDDVEEVTPPENDGDVENEEPPAPIDVVLAPASGNLGPNNISFATSQSGLEVFVTLDGTTQSLSGISPVLEELGVKGQLESGFDIVGGTDLAALASAITGGDGGPDVQLALAFVGGTEAVTSSVGVLLSLDPQELNGFEDITFTAGAAFARLTETTMPLTGGATYEGDYASILLANDPANPNIDPERLAIEGIVTLNADFANSVISGDITDRRFVDLEAEEEDQNEGLAELVLEVDEIEVDPDFISGISLAETAIDETGAFAGVASAEPSVVDGIDVTTENGVFTGLIAGTTANEAVGAVTVTHTLGEETFTEVGTFIAQ